MTIPRNTLPGALYYSGPIPGSQTSAIIITPPPSTSTNATHLSTTATQECVPKHKTVTVGVGVGVPLAALAITSLGALLFLRQALKREKVLRMRLEHEKQTENTRLKPELPAVDVPPPPRELDSRPRTVQLPRW